MIFQDKNITMKNGVEAVLRSPKVEEAKMMLDYIIKASGETNFLVRYPEEWDYNIDSEKSFIKGHNDSPNEMLIACFIDGQAAGMCDISFGSGIRDSHRAGIGIAILKEYWNLGIGSAMFTEMIAAAKEHGCEIMELNFVEGNERARHLYEKFGFKVVCEKPNYNKLKDGTYLSDFYMQKYL